MATISFLFSFFFLFMFKWWKKKKKTIAAVANDELTTIPIDQGDSKSPTKPIRSSVSFFLSQQDIHPKSSSMNWDSHRSSIPAKPSSPPLPLLQSHLQYLDQLIHEQHTCLGFSIAYFPSKSCLYFTIIAFLGICLIISFANIFKT